MSKPPSIGDEVKKNYRLIQEAFPMPTGRKALLAGIEQILAAGGVQRLNIKLGEPIRVVRAVEDDGKSNQVPTELIEDDVMSAARNCEMEEFPLPEKGMTPFEYIFRAFQHVGIKKVEEMRLRPKVFITKKLSLLRQWLGVTTLPDLFGVDVMQHIEMPDDGLLLVSSSLVDPEDVKFSLRMEIDLQWRTRT